MHPIPDNSKQLTPIEKAIAELDSTRVTDASSFTALKAIATMLYSLRPYERQYLRDVAEKAWDAGKNYAAHTFLPSLNSNTPDKQTYLNQNHPL